MVFYVLLRLSCKGALAKLLPKCKKSVLTPIGAYCQKLIINRSLTCCVHVLLYIDEQVYHLWDAFSVQVDEQCIKSMLKRVKWSKKTGTVSPAF